MSNETMNTVTIDVKNEVFDTTQNRITETTRDGVFNGRVGGTTKLVSVLKAYEQVRGKVNVKGNLNNLEVRVNDAPFCG